jgi:hypothetical protein
LQKRLLLNSSRIYLEHYNRSFAQSMKTAAAVFYRLDLRWKVTHLGFPKNYVIFAGKPDGQTVL